jgi:hypothetical protein
MLIKIRPKKHDPIFAIKKAIKQIEAQHKNAIFFPVHQHEERSRSARWLIFIFPYGNGGVCLSVCSRSLVRRMRKIPSLNSSSSSSRGQ